MRRPRSPSRDLLLFAPRRPPREYHFPHHITAGASPRGGGDGLIRTALGLRREIDRPTDVSARRCAHGPRPCPFLPPRACPWPGAARRPGRPCASRPLPVARPECEPLHTSTSPHCTRAPPARQRAPAPRFVHGWITHGRPSARVGLPHQRASGETPRGVGASQTHPHTHPYPPNPIPPPRRPPSPPPRPSPPPPPLSLPPSAPA